MSNGAQVPWEQYGKPKTQEGKPWEAYGTPHRSEYSVDVRLGTPSEAPTPTPDKPGAPRRFITGAVGELENILGIPKAVWEAFSAEPQTDEEKAFLKMAAVAPPPGMSPQMMLGLKRMFADPAIETGGKAVEAVKEGEYAKAALYGAASPIPGVNIAVPEIYEKSEAGDVAGAMGQALVFGGLLALAEPRVRAGVAKAARTVGGAAQAGFNLRRIKLAKAELTQVASPTPKDMKQFQADLDVALPEIAEVLRESGGFKLKGGQRVGELSDLLAKRAERIWREGHQPMIKRHARAGVDAAGMRNRVLAEIEKADRLNAPGPSRLAQKWAEFAFHAEKLTDLKTADALIRRINAEMRTLPEKYGQIGKRVRQRAVETLRTEVDRILESRGEAGVREINRRFGATRNVSRTLERRIKAAEAVAAHPITKSFASRHALTAAAGGLLGGGPGAIIAPALSAGSELAIAARRAPGAKVARAGRRLMRGQRGLPITPEVYTTPIRGLLTEGPTRLGPVEGPSGVRGLEPRSRVVRDQKTGRFKKVYLSETISEMMSAHRR